MDFFVWPYSHFAKTSKAKDFIFSFREGAENRLILVHERPNQAESVLFCPDKYFLTRQGLHLDSDLPRVVKTPLKTVVVKVN